MSSNFYSVGLNNVGSYQVSGIPFVSGSDMPGDTTTSLRFEFPTVTKTITFKSNYGHNMRIHFAPYTASFGYTNEAQTDNNYFLLLAGETKTFNVKCKEVFISSENSNAGSNNEDIQIIAELTNIPAERMFSLDGVEGVSS